MLGTLQYKRCSTHSRLQALLCASGLSGGPHRQRRRRAYSPRGQNCQNVIIVIINVSMIIIIIIIIISIIIM